MFAEYGIPYSQHDSYEVDHLIPLALGGNNSIRNLWPQPKGGSQQGYPAKDELEDHLHHMVCNGVLGLRTAQRAIARNWHAADHMYINQPESQAPTPPASAPPPPPPPSSEPSNGVVHPGAFCSPPGARGVTSHGTPMVCKTSATGSRYRWRSAG